MYTFKENYYPSPGTGNFAFVPNMTLPAFNVQGPGNLVRKQVRVMAGQQVVTLPAVPVAGVGGLQHGQVVQQGLIGNK